jgi:mono/diheme cytochrome c family protein
VRSNLAIARAILGVICLALPIPRANAGDATRGKYLAFLGDCAGCHNQAKQPAFSGGQPFKASFGTVFSTNITPDKQTGIGGWTENDFYLALHDGIAPGGKHLYPAFPYIYFQRITRQDTDDLFAFLLTLKPVNRKPTPNNLIFPVNFRFGLIFWNWLYFDKSPPKIPANASTQWKRGEYLVNGLGHCAACHTPKTILFGDETETPLAGGKVDNWFANNLGSGQGAGLGTWSKTDIETFLATGISAHAIAAGSMLEKISSSTSRMDAQDRAAIAAYLKSMPAQPLVASEVPRREQMERGDGLYEAHCQKCHAADGKPREGSQSAGYPNLAGNTLVMARDPTTVLRVILTGGTAPPATGQAPIKPMPDFVRLNDGMIADLATYLRNAWGNRAAPVSATQVHVLRQALKQ